MPRAFEDPDGVVHRDSEHHGRSHITWCEKATETDYWASDALVPTKKKVNCILCLGSDGSKV